jgi:type I restriction enzyme, S subunit
MSPLIQNFIDSIRTVGAQPKLALTRIRKFAIPLPPTEAEQRAIAAALGDVDGLLGGLDRLIAKKRDLKQTAMQQLLTGHTRLPGFSTEWQVKRLRDIVSTPITDGPHLTPQFLPDGVPFLSVNNLVNNQIDLQSLRFVSKADHLEFSKKCKPRKGDVLFGKAASVGMVALIETDMELNIWSPLALIRVRRPTSARFVCYALQASDVRQQIKLLTNSSSQGNIGMGEIGLLEIPLPEPDEQAAIATALSDMDAELAALKARRDKTRDVKKAMMQEVLTGKTRLVPAGAVYA